MADLWDGLIGQSVGVASLRAALTSGVLSHAYLFTGPGGVGKRRAARVFAAAMNCGTGGCGACDSCRSVMDGRHPDVTEIEPEGNLFNLEQVRAIQHEARLSRLAGTVKVIIMDEVDRLTGDAGNALLKDIEEPEPGVVFVLVTSNTEAVLPTIASRCREIRFKPVPFEELAAFLVDRFGVSGEEAGLAARVAGGILERAVALTTSEKSRLRRELGLDIAAQLEDSAAPTILAEELRAEVKRSVDDVKDRQRKETEQLIEDSGGALPSRLRRRLELRHKREIGREERMAVEESLDALASWYRDLLVYGSSGRIDIVANLDRAEGIKRAAGRFSGADLARCIRTVVETEQHLRLNVNIQLALETMLLRLQEVSVSCPP